MNTQPPANPAAKPWPGPLTLIVRASVLLVLSAVSFYVFLFLAPVITPAWLRILTSITLGIIATAAGLSGLALFGVGVIRWATVETNHHRLAGIAAGLQSTNHLLHSINDRIIASDLSKRIAYRQQERDALRTAIHQDIARRELDSAMTLVKMMSRLYGHHEEAEEFREQIQVARAQEMALKVATAIERLDETLAGCEWDKAASQATKIRRQFPDSPKTQNLKERVAQAREKHKHDLERQFLHAAQRDDVDKAMELLKELDRYLSEAEAEPYRETARGVIGKKRDNLGVQFRLAIQDKEWTVAVRVGEQLIREFPNSQMANEVRHMLDVLRRRATSQQAARV